MASEKEDPDLGVEPRYLKLADVARYLSVSTTQAYALVRSGELPAIKLGGRGVWRVDRTKLDAYLERLEEETRAWTETHPLGRKESAPVEEEAEDAGPPSNGPPSSAASSGGGKSRPKSGNPTRPPEGAETISAVEAAEIMGVTRQNVHHLIKTGRLRARKDGGRWLVSAEDARAYRPLGDARWPSERADQMDSPDGL